MYFERSQIVEIFSKIDVRVYLQRHEQLESGDTSVLAGPHLTLFYRDKSILDDAANLLIHHVKRQTSIHKDKQKMKALLRVKLPDMFFHPCQALSEDERDDDGTPNLLCYYLHTLGCKL